ncbi:MerR family transcriptional regulator [Nocardiopsis sp. Huas11]|uniref:MerR family transcriptional regulator n=1 Tax=Nocardiopsis sp. Huas11 TaxID=2183912 RepID=UPI000EAE9C6F|nr:MerR family transcriptional regulator [Nocardiopsis sp. Huas11]
MRIGELSERTGASRRSLRYYEQQGLLESRRTDLGWREYDDEAVVRVRNIRELFASGLTVADLQLVAPCLGQRIDPEYCHRTLEIYRRRLDRLETQISTLSGHRDRLAARLGEGPE